MPAALPHILRAASDNKPAAPVEPVAQLQTVDVLVAKSDIGLGQTVKPEDMQWQTWPAATASNTFIRRNERPDATTQIAGSIARAPFIAGEPIREPKLVKANGPASWRRSCPPACAPSRPKSRRRPAPAASSCRTTGSTSFCPSATRIRTTPASADVINSEIILSNVRVLAIDQAPKEKDGQNTVLGKTVTLELKPEQAETLARARQSGTLSLALRSIVDVNMAETDDRRSSSRSSGGSINVVRYGVSRAATTTQK